MEGRKTYSHQKGEIFSTIYDIIELQKGELILSDTRQGVLYFSLTMYDYIWELMYNITETGAGKCEVAIRVAGDRQDVKKEIKREFALLDAMLDGGSTKVRFIEDIASVQTRLEAR